MRSAFPKRMLLFAMMSLFASGVAAQEEPPLGWFDVAELTFVMTGGNASASTLGFKNTLDRKWENAAFQISAGGIRTETGTTVRTAIGSASNFQVTETTDTEKTAESYFVRSRFDKNVSDATFLFGGAGWDRNTFAGIENRFAFVTGAGRNWYDEEARRLRTDIGLTYTLQDDVVVNPDISDSFLGLRASYDYFRQVSQTTGFNSVLVVDENLDQTDDFRADWTNSIQVSISDNLALKTGLQLLFDNDPALIEVPLGSSATVLTPLDTTDSVFTVAIVASF